MKKRRRIRQFESLKDRLASFALSMREKASRLPPGPEQDDVLRRADRADTAIHLDEWANSPGLLPPK